MKNDKREGKGKYYAYADVDVPMLLGGTTEELPAWKAAPHCHLHAAVDCHTSSNPASPRRRALDPTPPAGARCREDATGWYKYTNPQ